MNESLFRNENMFLFSVNIFSLKYKKCNNNKPDIDRPLKIFDFKITSDFI